MTGRKTNVRSNRYAGHCSTCAMRVEADHGWHDPIHDVRCSKCYLADIEDVLTGKGAAPCGPFRLCPVTIGHAPADFDSTAWGAGRTLDAGRRS